MSFQYAVIVLWKMKINGRNGCNGIHTKMLAWRANSALSFVLLHATCAITVICPCNGWAITFSRSNFPIFDGLINSDAVRAPRAGETSLNAAKSDTYPIAAEIREADDVIVGAAEKKGTGSARRNLTGFTGATGFTAEEQASLAMARQLVERASQARSWRSCCSVNSGRIQE